MKIAVPVLAVALAFGVSACGSDSSDKAGGSSSPKSVEEQLAEVTPGKAGKIEGNARKLTPQQLESVKKVVECMRKKGYNMPEPTATSFSLTPTDVAGKDLQKVGNDSRECSAQAQPQGG